MRCLWIECGREDIEIRPYRSCCSSYHDRETKHLNLHEFACSNDDGKRKRKGTKGRAIAAFYYSSLFISRCFVYQISDNCSRGRDTFMIDFWFHRVTISLLNLFTWKSCSEIYAFRAATATVWNSTVPLSITSYQMPLSLPGDALARARARLQVAGMDLFKFATSTSPISCWDIGLWTARKFCSCSSELPSFYAADRCSTHGWKTRDSAAFGDFARYISAS